jgi:hypothetical protein
MKVQSVPPGQENALANAAVRAFSSWRLEPGRRDIPIQITFSFLIDTTLRYTDGEKIDWDLPEKLTIRANAPE